MQDFIPVNEPIFGGNEKKYLNECIDTGWISSEGPFVSRLEAGMAEYVGRRYGVAVCNGTAALDVAVVALQLQPGDEVIMPTFTIISCAAALIKQGVKPVLVDADIETWCMDTKLIEEKITSKTKAIMVVHIYGLPVDMDPVIDLANKYSLKIIEDAAEAHGLMYKGKKCGSFGDVSIMSFYPNKHITTGEGGIVLTDNEKIANRCRQARNLFFMPERRYVHEELGFNYRMSNLQAAVGVAQLERLEEHLEIKRNIGEIYQKIISEDYLKLPMSETSYAHNIYWVFGIVLNDKLKIDNIECMELLRREGVGTRSFFYPMHLQPVFKKMNLFQDEEYPVSEYLGSRGLYLPSGLALKENDIEYVASKLMKILEQYK